MTTILNCRKCHIVCEKSELYSICHKFINHAIWCTDCIMDEMKKNESNIIKCVLCGSENNITCDFEYIEDIHIEHTYINDKLNGENIKTYFEKSNILQSIGNYKNNIKYGSYIEYYKNGKKCIESNYNSKGILNGIVKKYNENQELISIEQYVEGEYDDIQSYYMNGHIVQEITYSKGVKSGATTIYYYSEDKDDELNGSIIQIDYYKDDIIENNTIYYPKTHIKKSYSNYKDGKLDGFSYTYDENGNEISSIEYKDDKPYNGIISYNNKIQNYKDGLLEGDVIEYYDYKKLKIKIITPYINNMINGIVKKYDENGNLIESIEYVNGEKNGKHDIYFYKRITKKIDIMGIPSKKSNIRRDLPKCDDFLIKSRNYCEKNDYIYKGSNKFADYASFDKEEGENTFMDEQFEVNQIENQNMMETEDAFMKRLKTFTLPYEFT
jgi:antitoxin component YwqK of YwqJK toxin-antitoxin module